MVQDSLQKTPADGIYVMGVAARLCGMHPQTLRKYERAGFLSPSRNAGQRYYSDEDILRLKTIKELVEDVGLNLAGVELVLNLKDRIFHLAEKLNRAKMERRQKEELMEEIEEILEMLRAA